MSICRSRCKEVNKNSHSSTQSSRPLLDLIVNSQSKKQTTPAPQGYLSQDRPWFILSAWKAFLPWWSLQAKTVLLKNWNKQKSALQRSFVPLICSTLDLTRSILARILQPSILTFINFSTTFDQFLDRNRLRFLAHSFLSKPLDHWPIALLPPRVQGNEGQHEPCFFNTPWHSLCPPTQKTTLSHLQIWDHTAIAIAKSI